MHTVTEIEQAIMYINGMHDTLVEHHHSSDGYHRIHVFTYSHYYSEWVPQSDPITFMTVYAYGRTLLKEAEHDS